MKFIIILICILFYTSRAHAYLDPGTFSIIASFFIAIIASVSTYILLFWSKIKSFFVKKNFKKKDSDSNSN
jgi:hypothetical protein